MTDQPRGLQTDLMKCSRETRQYVLGLGIEIERLTKQLAVVQKSSLASNLCPDHRDKQAGKSCLACEIQRLTEQRDSLWTDVTSWKDAHAVQEMRHKLEIERLKAERDEAREVARAYHIRLRSAPGSPPSAYDTFCGHKVEEHPWLEETDEHQ